jgi:hypothetical protein
MSGNYFAANQDAPGGLGETAAAVAAATSAAMADSGACQAASERFMAEYGAGAVAGHGTVEGPGGVGGAADL